MTNLNDEVKINGKHLKFLHPLIVQARRGGGKFAKFPVFDKYVKTNIDEICDQLSTRWLVSICDTFADFGADDGEKNGALMITVMVNMLKLGETWNHITPGETVDQGKVKQANKGFVIWSQVDLLRQRGDMPHHTFRRMKRNLRPYQKKIFTSICLKMHNSDNMISRLDKVHGSIFQTALGKGYKKKR